MVSRGEILNLLHRQAVADSGGARKPKGVRHCVEDMMEPSGLLRCAKYAPGPKGSALVGGARKSKGVRHCMREVVEPSGKLRCAEYMPGPSHGGTLIGGTPIGGCCYCGHQGMHHEMEEAEGMGLSSSQSKLVRRHLNARLADPLSGDDQKTISEIRREIIDLYDFPRPPSKEERKAFKSACMLPFERGRDYKAEDIKDLLTYVSFLKDQLPEKKVRRKKAQVVA